MASSDHSDDGDAIMMLKKTSLKGYPIKDACGNTECVVMTTFNGRVYTCDPTGVSKQENYVEVIFPTSEEEDEPDVDIVSVCCGRHHFLALSANGQIYSWGRNNVGQLGIPKKKQRYHNQRQTTQDFNPRLIKELSNYDVIQIACGDDHSLALTRDGRLFSWGCNRHGQLGLETKGLSKRAKHHVEKPIEIEGLWGIPLQHFAAGGAHSVAVSTTGSIFVWGRNTHGQLGLQQLDDVKLPVKLGSLSQGNVKVISCGMHHTSFLKQNGQLLVYGMGVDKCPCESDEWGESELRPGRPERFRTFSFLQSTNRYTYAVEEITHGIFVLDHDKVQKDGNLQLEPLEEGSMIDVFEPESSTDWPPGRYVFDPKVWEPSIPEEDYEHIVERFEEGTRRDNVADTNKVVRETEQQEGAFAEENRGDSDGCTTEAQDTKEYDTINDSGFGGFHDGCNEDGDFLDCSSSIDDAYSDDDSFVTCDQDYVSISCDAFHDDPGVETSPKHRQSTKDEERAATDIDTTAPELHSQQSGFEIPQSNRFSEEETVTLSSDAATHPTTATNPTGHVTPGTADTAQVDVSVMDTPALHVEHLVPIDDGITDLSAAVDEILVTNDHDCPARETLEDESGEANGGQENHQRPPRTWRRLCAGQENIFIIEQDESMKKDVHISITPGREIYTLSAERLQSLSDVDGDVTEEDASYQYTSMVFSSPACLNASFRQTGTNEVNGLNVDLKAARRAFEVISKNDKLLEKLSDVISVDLCTNIPQSTPHVEALRFIFILMECPVFSNPHRPWGRRALAAADRLMGFLHKASQAGENKSNSATLARWWKFEPMSFRRAITAYRLSLTILINDRALLEKELDKFQTYLRVLSSLNEVNLQHDILSIKTFYVKDLDKVDFQPLLSHSFANDWRQPPRPLRKFSWTSYPFLIDLEMKTKILEYHNISEQDDAMEQERILDPMFDIFPFFGIPPPRVSIHLEVNRGDIFGRSVREQLAEMLSFPRSRLQKPLEVHFMDEMGIDEGALSMEFFRLVFESLLDPEKNDLFRYVNELDPTHSSVWFRKDCEDSELAEICGLLFGLSLYNKAIVPLPFPQLLYAKLLGKGPNKDMEEAAELDEEFADQMSKLRNGTEDYVMGCCYGEKVKLEDGRSVDVTKENVDLYVDNMVREYLVPSQFAAFKQGFNRVFTPAAFGLFRPIELEALVIGEKYFDWKALEQSTQYIQPYTDSHPTIKIFWKVFHALDDDMKRKFLVFVAGSDRVPVGGLRNLGLHIDHLQVPMDDSVDEQPCDTEDRLTRLLPQGHGCDNHGFHRTLRLPMYTSLEVMDDRLTVALSYYDCPFHIA